MSSLGQAALKLALWREDPVRFVTEELGFNDLDTFQVEFFRSLGSERQRDQRLALKASKGPGKTFCLGGAGWWFLGCQGDKGEHPNGFAISNTMENLRDNLWKEMAKLQGRSEYLKNAFTWTKTRIYSNDHPATWWLAARTWSKTGDEQEQSDALAGLHSGYVLVLLDESGGIPVAILATAEAALSSCIWGKIAQAGNPTSLEGALHYACVDDRKHWKVITINGDPDDPKRAKRVSRRWARQQIEMFGRDNPWVLVNVFGEFPPSSINTLLSVEDVEKAFTRFGAIQENEFSYSQRRIGADVARFGDDRNVFYPRQGLVSLNPVVTRHQRGPQMAARIGMMIKRWGENAGRTVRVMIFVDDTGGYGATLEDSLHTAKIPYIPVDFGAHAMDPRYENKRAENWWEMAKWVKRGGSLHPEAKEIIPELTKVHYTFSKRGKLMIEPKDLIKTTLGFSPDMADALSCTFSIPDMPDIDTAEGASLVGAGYGNKLEHEWDPLESAEAEL